MSLLNLLGQSKVVAKDDGTLQVSDFRDYSGALKTWREIGPYHWEDATGGSHMAARVENGKVIYFASDDEPPVMVSMPVPAWASASWNLPLLYFTIGVLLLTVVLWPVQVLVRRRYKKPFPLEGRRALLYRLVRGVAIVDLLGLGTYALLFQKMSNIGMLDDPMNPMLRLAQFFCLLGVVGALVAIWNVVTVWTDRAAGWWAKGSSLLIAIACAAFAWFVLTLHLINASTQF
jgi:hypothetical protein